MRVRCSQAFRLLSSETRLSRTPGRSEKQEKLGGRCFADHVIISSSTKDTNNFIENTQWWNIQQRENRLRYGH